MVSHKEEFYDLYNTYSRNSDIWKVFIVPTFGTRRLAHVNFCWQNLSKNRVRNGRKVLNCFLVKEVSETGREWKCLRGVLFEDFLFCGVEVTNE